MPKIVDVAKKREHILEAATELCASLGCAGTTIGAVATRASIGKSTVYHYFPTREALLEALVVRSFCFDETALDEPPISDESPMRGLEQFLDRITEQLDRWVELGPAAVELLTTPSGRAAYERAMALVRQGLRPLIVAGQRSGALASGDSDSRVALVIGCLQGALLQTLVEPQPRSPGRVAEVARAMVLGSLARGTGTSPGPRFGRRATDRPARPVWR